jgi:AraC-like DNA-binding protein
MQEQQSGSATGSPGTGVAALRVSTGAAPARQSAEKWREEFARGFLRLDIAPRDPECFQADATIRMLPGLKIGSCAISASDWRRTRAMIDPSTDEFGFMFGCAGPALLSQRGRTLELAFGDAATCSHLEPTDLTLPGTNARHVGLVVPLKPLAALVPDLEARMPCRIPRGSEPLRLLTGYLDALSDEVTFARPELGRAVVTHVYDLIALALGPSPEGAELVAGRGLRAARLRTAKADIVANLRSRELSVTAVAKRQGITPRYLHMLFEAEGTSFSQFVLRQRLDLAHTMLTNSRYDHLAITAVAFAAGFGDLSNFNHTFRRRYGATPRDVRKGQAHARLS